MYNFGYADDKLDETNSREVFERRDGIERRVAPACGFAYISTVGWVCRREQFRREDDFVDER